MTIKTVNAWHLCALVMAVAFLLIGVPDPAGASEVPIVLKEACIRARDLWEYGQRAIYIVGGIGIIVCAIFAFIGRFRWSMLFAITGGVFLVAMAGQLVEWLAGRTGAC